VHLIAVPETESALRGALGEAHRRYTRRINFRHGWRGHLWQGRFASFVMDETYLLACADYVERNPVRARLCRRPGAYRWSSAAAHLAGRDDTLVRVAPLLALEPRWAEHLRADPDADLVRQLRRHEATGRPAGDDSFLRRLERKLGRVLRPRPAGRKRKVARK
jgi:putative transposase